jgi:hypothetical protein
MQDDGMTLGEVTRDETPDAATAPPPTGGAPSASRPVSANAAAATSDAAASEDDVAALYQLLLGRAPSDADRAGRAGLPLGRLAAELVASREFERNVAATLEAGRPLPQESRSGSRPPTDLSAWVERRLLRLANPGRTDDGTPPRLGTWPRLLGAALRHER